MREYGCIKSKYWTNPDIVSLSDQAKLLGSYLLTAAHTTMLGCFRIPLGYIAEDFRWGIDTAKKAMDDLANSNFLTYDDNTKWVMIHNFLKHNPIENPNQGKSIKKLFDEVPKQCIFISQLLIALKKYNKYFEEDCSNPLETLSKPFPSQEQDQEQNQNQEQKKESVTMSDEADICSVSKNDYLNNKKIYALFNEETKQKAEAILNFLNLKAHKSFEVNADNLKHIAARLSSGESEDTCRQIIVKKTYQWKDNQKMNPNLNAKTLFMRENFYRYKGELVLPKEESASNDSQCMSGMS